MAKENIKKYFDSYPKQDKFFRTDDGQVFFDLNHAVVHQRNINKSEKDIQKFERKDMKTEPVEPIKPTEPIEPVEPTQPTEPIEPIEPEKTAEPIEPVKAEEKTIVTKKNK